MSDKSWIVPDWPAPPHVRALITTREGGVSKGPYASMNPADHVGDDPASVRANRALLRAQLPGEPVWLKQVHGVGVHRVLTGEAVAPPEADASVSSLSGAVCVVLTADCLPVLFCDTAGTVVAAAHAGWRGLCAGVLEQTVESMQVAPGEIMAWLGPAIGPQAFEVGAEVREAFMAVDEAAAQAFISAKPEHGSRNAEQMKFLADIYLLARQRLARVGVRRVFGGGACTFNDPLRFYSFRRDGATGRMASLIWLQPESG